VPKSTFKKSTFKKSTFKKVEQNQLLKKLSKILVLPFLKVDKVKQKNI
jgi:hypothetical protein